MEKECGWKNLNENEKNSILDFNEGYIKFLNSSKTERLANMFIVNEIEGAGLSGVESDNIKDIIDGLLNKFNDKEIVLTVGAEGSYFIHKDGTLFQEAYKVDAVDTTAAGDTFTGYFLASYLKEKDVRKALDLAAKASAITCKSLGAAKAIPTLQEVLDYE